MYESVRVSAGGPTTPARFVATVASSGFDGCVVRNQADQRADYDAALLRDEYGVDVVDAIEIDAQDPSSASGAIGNYRDETTILVVRGGTPTLNRYVAESRRVDVLAAPMRDRGDVNHVVVKAAAANDVRLEFDLAHVLRREGGPRVQALRGLRKLRELVEHYDAPFVVSASPRSHLAVRAPRELLAVGEVVGFERAQIEAGLAEWGVLARRNRERLSPEFVSPGVRRGRYQVDNEAIEDGTDDGED